MEPSHGTRASERKTAVADLSVAAAKVINREQNDVRRLGASSQMPCSRHAATSASTKRDMRIRQKLRLKQDAREKRTCATFGKTPRRSFNLSIRQYAEKQTKQCTS